MILLVFLEYFEQSMTRASQVLHLGSFRSSRTAGVGLVSHGQGCFKMAISVEYVSQIDPPVVSQSRIRRGLSLDSLGSCSWGVGPGAGMNQRYRTILRAADKECMS